MMEPDAMILVFWMLKWLKKFFFIEGIALQNFFLFSVKPQHESAIDTHISHPF